MPVTGRTSNSTRQSPSRGWGGRVNVVSLTDPADEAETPEPWWRRRPSAATIALGSSAALALALLFGLLLSPSMDRAPPGAEPVRAAIRQNAPAPISPAALPAAPRLDVAVQPASPGQGASIAPAETRRSTPTAPPAVPKPRAAAALAASDDGRDSSPPSEPSFDCRYARSPAELMVCDDSELAAADRRLDRAYRRAVRAGAPEAQLRRAQDRWLDVRERAAPDPDAVAEVYERRIEQLDALSR